MVRALAVTSQETRRWIIMRISRRAAAVVAAVLTALATLGVAGAALASPSAPRAHHGVQVLRLHSEVVAAANNSAGHGGPGDVLSLVVALKTPSGAKAGKELVSLQAFPGHQSLGHSAFILRGGQIDAMVAVADTATRFTAAIIGGTGIYEGVTGQIRNVETPSGLDLTFYIIRPHH
jgi:hypothetical protein